jgi:hypothetical protein|tara:strand:- start:9176 stop:9772 length:597 start_codon:yes stop_codon:yes gene_type:complete
LKEYDDDGLIVLIHKSDKNPSAYTKLLVDHIFPTLDKISNKLTSDSVVHNLNSKATSLINQVYNQLSELNSNDDCVLFFYRQLRDIIKAILLDKSHHRNSQNNLSLRSNIDLLSFLSEEEDQDEYSINDVDNALDLLKLIEPNAYQALSFKLYTASSNLHIATLLDQPIESVDRYITEGSKILVALMRKPNVINGLAN